MSNKNKISRRDFIKDAAIASAAVAATGILGSTPAQAQTSTQWWLPAKWDAEADVVVVGFGGAGAVAAITAKDAGAKVLILEKMTEALAGGNTGCCGGDIFTPINVEQGIKYLNALCFGFDLPADIVQVWAQKMGENPAYMKSIGGNPVEISSKEVTPPGYNTSPNFAPEFPELPGNECARTYAVGVLPGRGVKLFGFLKGVVQQRGITVMYETPATELIQNPQTKEILGVKATSKGSTINIKANRAVALTCGGFENNQQMIRDYLGMTTCFPRGTHGNTGDGVVMAMNAGATLWHMDNASGNGVGIHPLPDLPAFSLAVPGNSYIYIGSDGTRFVNEKVSSRHGKIPFPPGATPSASTTWIPFPTPMPMHVIFDETTRKKGPVTSLPNPEGGMGYLVVHPLYSWSADNSAEIAKGWILQGNTIQDLAAKIGRNPAALAKVVETYNQYCTTGVDADFGRPKATLEAITTPPYYAISLVPVVLNTQGGPQHNPKSQVVDAKGKPIPRLYAAGELGSIYSWLYNGGGNIGETIAFGRIAGENAAAEKPWA